MSFWAVVTTFPRSETLALAQLRQQGFVCYAPVERAYRVRNGTRSPYLRLLFPRYLFIWVVDQWRSVLGTFGVSRLLMNGERPSRLPVGWVDGMRSREKNGAVELPKERFYLGQRVQVARGLFRGQRGLYQGMTSRQREVVLLDALGRVELAPADLL